MKIRPMAAMWFHADGRAVRQEESDSRF